MSDHLPVEHVVAADGTTLAIRRRAGTGGLIVALHGFTGDGTTMQPLVDASAGDRPVLLIDLVGHGASDSPPNREPYAMTSVVDQVLSIIGPHPVGTVHLIGYSMGGRIALSIAARAPWYFASITTISASPGLADPVERASRYDLDQRRADELEASGIAAFVEDWLALPLFASYVAALTPEQRDATSRQRETNDLRGLANSLRETGTGSMPPVWQSLPAIRTPLLAIAGELDERYVQIAKAMAERAPFGRTSVVPGAGHVTHIENCDEVSAIVAQFLEVCENNADHPR